MTSGCPWPKATVKPPMWNPGPKFEIPHLENHVLKVFRFRSWKPRVWISRPQSWDPKSWKPCPENHILKFPRPQSWDLKSWKPCPENHILKFPGLFAWLPCPACQTDRQTNRHCRWRKTLRKVTIDNFPQWVFFGAKVAELHHWQSGPDPAHHPVLHVGYPGSPFRAKMS
jgi:hypothetical protein